jgi:hypothetical protein
MGGRVAGVEAAEPSEPKPVNLAGRLYSPTVSVGRPFPPPRKLPRAKKLGLLLRFFTPSNILPYVGWEQYVRGVNLPMTYFRAIQR